MLDENPLPPATPPTITSEDPNSIAFKKPLLFSSKGFIIASVFVLLAVIVAVGALFSFNSASDYQGLIKKVESQTQELQNRGDQ